MSLPVPAPQHPVDAPVVDDAILRAPARLAALEDTHLMRTPGEAVFDRWSHRAMTLCAAPVCLVSLVDEATGYFKSFVHAGGEAADSREVPIGASLCRETVVRGHPMVVEDTSRDGRARGYAAVEQFPIGAYAAIPLRSGEGHVLGAFCVLDHAPRPWTTEQLAALEDLGLAVESEIRHREATSRERRLRAFLALHREVHRHLTHGRAVDDVVDAVLAAVPSLVGHATGARYDRVGPGTAGARATEVWSFAVVAGRRLGTLHVETRVGRAPRGDERDLLTQTADLLAVALERHAAEAALRSASTSDPLTGLTNRRSLDGELQALLDAEPGGVAVLFCDLDDFKRVNDERGHGAGDAVLRGVARRLTAALRARDLVARFGGDEFVVASPVRDPQDAERLADRLRLALSAPVADGSGGLHAVGATIGVALARGGTAADALERADADMYARKPRRLAAAG